MPRPAKYKCTHTSTRKVLVECEPDYDDPHGIVNYSEGQTETFSTTEDIDIGRYRCTRCGEIMYYTGRWKNYHEKGIPL